MLLRVRRLLALVAFVSATSVSGCREPTELVFRITTDVPCARVHGTSIAVGTVSSVSSKPPASTSATCTDGKIGALVVVPSGSDSDEVAVQVVTGIDAKTSETCDASAPSGGCIVARRALRFLPNARTDVPIAMEEACRDVACSPENTCWRGACVSSHADCTQPGACAESVGPAVIPTPPPTKWKSMRSSSAGGVRARAEFSALWSGQEMLIFGGTLDGSIADDGGRYDPAKDSWTIIPPAPLGPRYRHAAVWTGKEMLVWGGYGTNDGGAYFDGASFDPATAQWTKMPAPPAELEGPTRERVSALWAPTTGELLIWGGSTEPNPVKSFRTGAAYDPVAKKWRMMAPSPLTERSGAPAFWVDGRMLVFGGDGERADGALYDPKTDHWSAQFASTLTPRDFAVAAWSGALGDPLAFWSGADSGDRTYADGVTLDPSSLQFDAIAPLDVLDGPARFASSGWMSHRRLWIWGGSPDTKSGKVAQGGASYDLTTHKWTALPTEGAPAGRFLHAAVWTGSEAIVWGGVGADGKMRDDGARFGL